MTFAERLRMLREERNMTLEEVAQILGVGRANIYKYEHGIVTNIPPDKIHKLANLFGVTRPYLMGWTDDRNVNPSENLDTVAQQQRNIPSGEIVTEDNETFWRAAGTDIADCTTAATQALRALIKFGINRTPIYPQHILQHSQYTTMITFGHFAEIDEITMFSDKLSTVRGTDLYMSSTVTNEKGEDHYLFVVNRYANIGHLKLALAVELGHIYLGHTSMLRNRTRKNMEAQCFATHLVFPRPVIKLLSDRGFIFTKKTFSRIFGDCEWCLNSILNSHPVSVSPELNRLVKDQFVPYVDQLEKMGLLSIPINSQETIDFSQYMEGYEE